MNAVFVCFYLEENTKTWKTKVGLALFLLLRKPFKVSFY